MLGCLVIQLPGRLVGENERGPSDETSRDGGAVLIVTHSDAIAAHADRIIRIEDGKIAK